MPIGLLLGYLLGKTILPFALEIFTSGYSNVSVVVSPNAVIFIGAALFSVFTVLLSIRKPIRIVARISPIEALRYCEEKKEHSKVKHTKKVSMWRLALSNVMRNKKRSAFIIISMTLCCLLLNLSLIHI